MIFIIKGGNNNKDEDNTPKTLNDKNFLEFFSHSYMISGTPLLYQ